VVVFAVQTQALDHTGIQKSRWPVLESTSPNDHLHEIPYSVGVLRLRRDLTFLSKCDLLAIDDSSSRMAPSRPELAKDGEQANLRYVMSITLDSFSYAGRTYYSWHWHAKCDSDAKSHFPTTSFHILVHFRLGIHSIALYLPRDTIIIVFDHKLGLRSP
jgi:hypothetical protein